MKKKGRDEDTALSPNLKQQPINHRAWHSSKGMHGLFLSAKWLPVSTPKLRLLSSSFSLSPYLVMSHCIFQYILPQTCGGEVVLGGWGFIDVKEACCLALTNELSGQTSSEWE